ncbi:MAG: hypothetical protein V1775_10185 [Bacteroidota bacterium]
MKKRFFLPLIVCYSLIITLSSCEAVEELTESKTEKTIRIFTNGIWNVDTLVTKTDVFSGGISNITSDSTFNNYGTIEFQKPNQTYPGYGAGFMIHKYVKNGIGRTDTAAWVPYNFQSTNDGTITLFFAQPGEDFVVDAYDMYLDLETMEDKKIRISGWRRETIQGGSGGSQGSYRRYHLTR